MTQEKIHIKELPLSVRTKNCLMNAEIKNALDIQHYSENELLLIQDFGKKSLQDLRRVLNDSGIALPRTNNRDIKTLTIKQVHRLNKLLSFIIDEETSIEAFKKSKRRLRVEFGMEYVYNPTKNRPV